jgi:hypothetical protein
VTLVGVGVWEAKTGVGVRTPEINVTKLKQEINKRLKASLFTFITISSTAGF